jgi:three-Cys-motif partner protein
MSKNVTDGQFGGGHSKTKLDALEYYLDAYVTALRNRPNPRNPFRLHYIDAFAGKGTFAPRIRDELGTASPEERAGSAKIALDVPGFKQYTFIELDPKHCDALRKLTAKEPAGRVWVMEGNANTILPMVLQNIDWKNSRGVLFLDPYGMQLQWEVLEQAAKTEALDVWYLFPLSAVLRQMPRSESALDESKIEALNRLLGTTEWRNAFYAAPPMGDLFGGVADEREADADAILAWFSKRLEQHFAYVAPPAKLMMGAGGKATAGPALFALYFMVSNPAPAATKLARDISSGVLHRLRKAGAVA